jgi:hypothetical protein
MKTAGNRRSSLSERAPLAKNAISRSAAASPKIAFGRSGKGRNQPLGQVLVKSGRSIDTVATW